jgi:23S rRNA pseudouridine1911/1915/1917 synthase
LSKPEISRKLEVLISDDRSGLRLDRYLADHPEIGTRSKAARLIDLGLVTAGGRTLKSSYRVQPGDRLTVEIPRAEPTDLQPLHLPLQIVFEDDDCLVINKPAGLVVHPAAGHAQDTLVNALVGQIARLTKGFGEQRPGIVHRLDKDTSGLLVIAKNDTAHEALAQQFRKKTVHRIYWAMVFGKPRTAKKIIESNLGRHPTQRKKFSSRAEGKRAVTHYELLRSAQGISLLRCRLETGRTHQIRVHLSELGHAVIGDRIYSSSRALQPLGKVLRTNITALERIGLHACELGFLHPRTGEFKKFFMPWPEDLQTIVQQVGFVDVSKAIAP